MFFLRPDSVLALPFLTVDLEAPSWLPLLLQAPFFFNSAFFSTSISFHSAVVCGSFWKSSPPVPRHVPQGVLFPNGRLSRPVLTPIHSVGFLMSAGSCPPTKPTLRPNPSGPGFLSGPPPIALP